MNAAQLISAVERAIGQLAPAYANAATESDLYEAALLAAAVDAATQAGGQSQLTNDGNTPTRQLVFRRSPGNIWAAGYTHARVVFQGTLKWLEIHLGVFVLGVSGVAHECDVAVLDGVEAERGRQGGVHPRRRGLVAAIEAKHYVASPGIDIGRAFLGLAGELGQVKCSLAFPALSSASLATLIARKQSECFDEVIPAAPASQRLQAHLEQSIRNWLA
jgi:hypothetical protein